jgi:hypothetical protein
MNVINDGIDRGSEKSSNDVACNACVCACYIHTYIHHIYIYICTCMPYIKNLSMSTQLLP